MGEVPGIKAKKTIYTIQKNSYNSIYMYPLVIADEHDCMIKDIDRHEFLDFTSNIGSSPLGYAHPDILEIRAKYAKIEIGQDSRTGFLL